jgi:hypothetical protein
VAISRRATSSFDKVGHVSTQSGHEVHGVGIPAHDAGSGRNVVRDDQIAAFSGQLCLGIRNHVVGFGGKAHHEGRPALGPPRDRGQDVWVFDEPRGGSPLPSFFILAAAAEAVRQSATAAANTPMSAGKRCLDGGEHVPGALDMHRVHAGRVRQGHGAGHESDPGARFRSGPAMAWPCFPEERFAM